MTRALFIAALLLSPNAGAIDQQADWTPLLLSRMKCACDVAGERVFNERVTLGSDKCTCDLGKSMRKRVTEFVGAPGTRDASQMLEFLESLTDEDPANERYMIYDQNAHKTLMENTMCTCGCGKMALSQCPLDCPWSPVYQRRFKFLLALGYELEPARQYYLDDANRVHRKGKQPFDLNTITLNQEKPLSWVLPVCIGVIAFLIVFFIFAKRGRATAAKDTGPAGTDPPQPLELSEDDRELLADELDDIGG